MPSHKYRRSSLHVLNAPNVSSLWSHNSLQQTTRFSSGRTAFYQSLLPTYFWEFSMDVYRLHKSTLSYRELKQPCPLPPSSLTTQRPPHRPVLLSCLKSRVPTFRSSQPWLRPVSCVCRVICSLKIGKELWLRQLRTCAPDLPQRRSVYESEVVSLFLLSLHTPSMMAREELKQLALAKERQGLLHKPSKWIVACWWAWLDQCSTLSTEFIFL